MQNFSQTSRRLTLLVLAVVTGSTLTACSSGITQAEPEDALSPQERLEQEAGVTIEPGVASCSFNNEIDDHHWDGSGSHPLGVLDAAEIRETEDTYEVTLTGEFFDPSLVAEDTYFNAQIQLHNAEESVGLYTAYRANELVNSGTLNKDGDMHEQETGAKLEPGLFTASFPKDAPDFEGFSPDMWFAHVYFSGADEELKPLSFRCGDGRSWNWEPLGS